MTHLPHHQKQNLTVSLNVQKLDLRPNLQRIIPLLPLDRLAPFPHFQKFELRLHHPHKHLQIRDSVRARLVLSLGMTVHSPHLAFSLVAGVVFVL